jgi:hypothetical protein
MTLHFCNRLWLSQSLGFEYPHCTCWTGQFITLPIILIINSSVFGPYIFPAPHPKFKNKCQDVPRILCKLKTFFYRRHNCPLIVPFQREITHITPSHPIPITYFSISFSLLVQCFKVASLLHVFELEHDMYYSSSSCIPYALAISSE